MKNLLGVLLLVGGGVQAAEIQAIKVSGEKTAEISFILSGQAVSPRLSVEENRVELFFDGTSLSNELAKSVDISAPHALVQRISSMPANGGSRVRVVINGSAEKLRDRVKLQKKDGTIQLVLTYPAGQDATLKLLQEEQAKIETPTTAVTEAKSGFGWGRLALILVLFTAAAGGTYGFVRFSRKTGSWKGSRRHLIETIAQHSLDGKASVSILRVGSEFVLVGVTPSSVNLLSALPRLAEEYEEETRLERGSFKEAIVEEVRKTQRAEHRA